MCSSLLLLSYPSRSVCLCLRHSETHTGEVVKKEKREKKKKKSAAVELLKGAVHLDCEEPTVKNHRKYFFICLEAEHSDRRYRESFGFPRFRWAPWTHHHSILTLTQWLKKQKTKHDTTETSGRWLKTFGRTASLKIKSRVLLLREVKKVILKCQVLLYFLQKRSKSILTWNTTNWCGCCTPRTGSLYRRWFKSAQNIIGIYLQSVSDISEVRILKTAPTAAGVWPEIQEYSLPYHQTTEQLLSSGCEAPELILNYKHDILCVCVCVSGTSTCTSLHNPVL